MRIATILVLAVIGFGLFVGDRRTPAAAEPPTLQWLVSDKPWKATIQAEMAQFGRFTTYNNLIWKSVKPGGALIYPTETNIDCEKHTRKCVLTDAYYGTMLDSQTMEYDITAWSSDVIVAHTTAGLCLVGRELSIDLKNSAVTVRTYPTRQHEEGCSAFEESNVYSLRPGAWRLLQAAEVVNP